MTKNLLSERDLRQKSKKFEGNGGFKRDDLEKYESKHAM
jgi:hypothetical protein